MDALRSCDRAALEATFARGLASLWMAYQPIVRAHDGAVFGFEALVRTGEPSLAHAHAVLHAAEMLERLLDLGRAVRACVAGRAIDAAPETLLFVNVDTRELFDGTLTSPDGPLAPIASRVVLEITERTSLERLDGIGRRVAELRERGYRIALDDLGAGYAGLASFAMVEPDLVKLDRSLVRDLHASSTKQKLVRALADVSHDLGCLVVGEGVETPDERDAVVDLGCDLLQGFLLGRPADAPRALVAR
jgi:EAL domain-containing protein (putative c-di-GMP-specific phosphodiesterase class I)